MLLQHSILRQDCLSESGTLPGQLNRGGKKRKHKLCLQIFNLIVSSVRLITHHSRNADLYRSLNRKWPFLISKLLWYVVRNTSDKIRHHNHNSALIPSLTSLLFTHSLVSGAAKEGWESKVSESQSIFFYFKLSSSICITNHSSCHHLIVIFYFLPGLLKLIGAIKYSFVEESE